jgi:1-deoxy-D-xylulose-5-phosphate reductoisomerase
LILLGSTGSIGLNTLAIAERYAIDIELLSAGKNVEVLNGQIARFKPKYVAISDKRLKSKINHTRIFCGEEELLEAIALCKSETVVNAIVGFAGLRSTIRSLELGKKVALANKESLVVAGAFIDTTQITPIDSEHFALSYLVQDKPIKKMSITASGGSFRDYPLEKLGDVTVKEALNHPNWSMGSKITIDSATMTNKLFELLEAKWLFPKVQHFDAFIETQSIMHAVIDFVDGSSTTHLAGADMKLPIAYAIKDAVEEPILPPVDLVALGSLEFRAICEDRYPIWAIKEHILEHPHLGVVVNAANEVAVAQFLDGKIGFLDIGERVLETYDRYRDVKVVSLEDVFALDEEIRKSF